MDESKACTEDTRDQPNNEGRIALEDGPGGGDSFHMGESSSAGFSGPIFSLKIGSSSTDAITDIRA